MRTRPAALAALGALLVAGAAAPDRAPRLVWNATASAPVGAYWVDVGRVPRAGELAAWAPDPLLASWLDASGHAPAGTLLLKQVAAREGAQVCRAGAALWLDGAVVAVARQRDGRGRVLPTWAGCRRLRAGQLLLLNAPADSLDGRYFGAVGADAIVGRARWIGGPSARSPRR